MTAEERFWHAFDEMEKEEDGYKMLVEWWRQHRAEVEEEGGGAGGPAPPGRGET